MTSKARRAARSRQPRPFVHHRAAENALWELLFDFEEPEPPTMSPVVRHAEAMVRAAMRRPDVTDCDELAELAAAEVAAQRAAVDIVLVQDRAGRWQPQARLGWERAPDLQRYLEHYPVLEEMARQGYEDILRWAGLNPQESDVLMLDAAGFTLEAIATLLHIRVGFAEKRRDDAYMRIQMQLNKVAATATKEAM